MKLWLDTVGRALIEFILIIALVALMGGLDSSVGPGQRDGRSVLLGSARSAIAYMPLAVAATIFLSMFAFERRVSSRAAGWLGLLTIGCLLFAAYFGLLGLSAGGSLARAAGDQAKRTQVQAPQAGLAAERGLSLLWAQDFGPGQAQAVVAADFARPYPRLRYAGTAPY
ncbi:MAG TPA: hypothetical protein VFL04_06915, partial [Rectinemataceae bacterium]|nr:hypothetical protein [Rectinemataceae bacterium]